MLDHTNSNTAPDNDPSCCGQTCHGRTNAYNVLLLYVLYSTHVLSNSCMAHGRNSQWYLSVNVQQLSLGDTPCYNYHHTRLQTAWCARHDTTPCCMETVAHCTAFDGKLPLSHTTVYQRVPKFATDHQVAAHHQVVTYLVLHKLILLV